MLLMRETEKGDVASISVEDMVVVVVVVDIVVVNGRKTVLKTE